MLNRENRLFPPDCNQGERRTAIASHAFASLFLLNDAEGQLYDDVCLLVGWLVVLRLSNMLDRSKCFQRQKLQMQIFFLTQSQYTDTGPTSPSADPITPGIWQGNHWSTNFEVTGMTQPRKRSTARAGIEPRSAALEADALTTRPTRRS